MSDQSDIERIYDISGDVADDGPNIRYQMSVRKRNILVVAVVIVTFITAILTLILGNLNFPLDRIFNSLITFDTETLYGRIVWRIDMPMIVVAILVGAILSLSGTVMQCILKNPLASPYTLGLSSAAAFGAAFSIVFLQTGSASSTAIDVTNPYVTMACAFLFSMISLGIIMFLTKLTTVSAETMILAGVAIGALFSAGLTFIQYFADSAQLSAIVSWSFGNLNHSDWAWNLIMFCILLPSAAYFMFNRWNLNAMDAGDEVAKGLGVNTDRFRIVSLILTAFISSVVVSRFGVIAFIGLLGPHIARMIVGSDHRHLIPMAILVGGCILLVANCVAVNIMRPAVLPVGLLTSLLGAPLFIFLLLKRYRK